MTELQNALACAARVFELLDAEGQTPEAENAAKLVPDGRVQIEDVSFRYLPDRPLIEGLSLDVKPGQRIAIVGPTGCGKTTLLRMIAGFNSIEGGDIFFNEKRINDMDPSKRNIGMVFQNYAIFPNLSVRDNVAFGLKNRKVDKAEIKKRTDEFLNLMQIMQYADRMPNSLSGGQQQRIALARALVTRRMCC